MPLMERRKFQRVAQEPIERIWIILESFYLFKLIQFPCQILVIIHLFNPYGRFLDLTDPSLASDHALRQITFGIRYDREGREYGERGSQQARILETTSRIGIREIHDFIASNCRGRTKDYHIILTGGRLYLRPASVRSLTFISQLSLVHINGTQMDGIAISFIPPRHTRTRNTHHGTYGSYQFFIFIVISIHYLIYLTLHVFRIRNLIVPLWSWFVTKISQILFQICDILFFRERIPICFLGMRVYVFIPNSLLSYII